uniref:Uncharacterized protein n=1 Tax=Myotis myotis TaxID=51298 RepID=A0A7J7WW08_MYOMY|nr:hypothetical protein mMyoMyo1_011906 [Myotis myotis]
MQLKLCEHKNLHSQISREKKKDYKRIKINGKGHLNRSRRQKDLPLNTKLSCYQLTKSLANESPLNGNILSKE